MDQAAYLQGLLAEREGYVKRGIPHRVAEVDAEIKRVSGLSVDDATAAAANPLPAYDPKLDDYLAGLVIERDGYLRSNRADRAAEVGKEIARVEAIIAGSGGAADALGAEQVDLENLDRGELLAIAEDLGIEVAPGTKTKTLVKLILEAQAAAEEQEQPNPDDDGDADGIAGGDIPA
jgi:hypothetical protein